MPLYQPFDQPFEKPTPAYPPTGSYGAIGDPVIPTGVGYPQSGYDTGQFISTPQEPNWQGYDGCGDEKFTNHGGYDNSTHNFYSQDNAPPSNQPEGFDPGFSNSRGGLATRGNQGHCGMQHSRGGFDGFDGFTRGVRGGNRGQYGAGRGTGRGQFNTGARGRGPHGGGNGNRGRGQYEGGYRGRGQADFVNRGRGQTRGANRGRGQINGVRGRGQPDGGEKGRGLSDVASRGQGQFHNNRGRGHFIGMNRGRGQSDGGIRGRDQMGGTVGRGWVSGGTQDLGQEAAIGRCRAVTRGRGQDASSGRGHGQIVGDGNGQTSTIGRGQHGRGQPEGTRGVGATSRGRGRADGVPTGAKATKPFIMLTGEGFISYKNKLQEFAQKNHKPVPQYSSRKTDMGYTADVCVDNQMFSCLQTEREKKDAEQSAAFEALKCLGFIDANESFTAKLGSGKAKKRPSDEREDSVSTPKFAKQEQPSPVLGSQSYKSKINEAVMKMKLGPPTYDTIRTAGGFLSTLVLNGQLYQGVERHGTKKLAEQHVAEIAFKQLDTNHKMPIKQEGFILDNTTERKELRFFEICVLLFDIRICI
ncbi:hornerin-like isoform X2 [Dendronephthya gigantea]|uniref:hornerin-like isoform X2 n=1 Tax=Dendronephthya gigantea TaxID=151771 RepID=UPI00106B9A5A|nr:hornerin-like isoform X2 [Dendronephthya gigantea]